MTSSRVLVYFGAALLAQAIPGPAVILAITNGARHGLGRASWGLVGAIAADLLIVAALACGLGTLLASSQGAFNAIKWAGAAYICYLGARMLFPSSTAGRKPDGLEPSAAWPDIAHMSPRGLIRQSFVVGITNPKALLFFSAFLPHFVDAGQPLLRQYLWLAAAQAVARVLTLVSYGAAGARLKRHAGSGRAWVGPACGATLLCLGVLLALYRRGEH